MWKFFLYKLPWKCDETENNFSPFHRYVSMVMTVLYYLEIIQVCFIFISIFNIRIALRWSKYFIFPFPRGNSYSFPWTLMIIMITWIFKYSTRRIFNQFWKAISSHPQFSFVWLYRFNFFFHSSNGDHVFLLNITFNHLLRKTKCTLASTWRDVIMITCKIW